MTILYRIAAAVTALALVSGCETMEEFEERTPKTTVDAAEIGDLLLRAGDPAESVRFFEQALAAEPDRVDFRRGLAISYTRAKRYPEAARLYEEMIAVGQAEPQDALEYALVSARLSNWENVKAAAADLPGGFNTARRHLLDAMIADHDQTWEIADAAYGRAEALSRNPATVLNNWGVSYMARGDYPQAEATFQRALTYDGRLFNAKNNLAIVRGLQGNYQLPVVPMTAIEKAIILNNLGLIALRQEREDIARGLFAQAVETHPQHYPGAAGRLAALEAVVEN